MSLAIPLQIQGSGTITSAAAGTNNDISAITATDVTLEVTISDLHSASGVPYATIVFEDTVDAYTGKIQRAVIDIQGTVTPAAPDVRTFRMKDHMPNLRLGTSSAACHMNVEALAAISGSSPSLTYSARLI